MTGALKFLALLIAFPFTGPAAPDPVETAASGITAAEVEQHVAYLASDELRGRDTPSPGLDEAARYLAVHFESLGLQPGGDSDSFEQRFPVGAPRFEPSALSVELRRAPGDGWRARYGADYFAFPSPVDSAAGPLVFMGQADNAGPSPDVAGAVAVYLTPGTPGEQDWGRAAGRSLVAAAQSGAAAVVWVLDAGLDSALVERTAQVLAAGAPMAPVPAIALEHAAARELLRRVGAELDSLAAPGATGHANARIGPEAELILRLPHLPAPTAPNVVALLRGSDPVLKDSYIVISAHFDHDGVGLADATGDSIFNGADDNASGTAALLEVAQAFTELPNPPARSVVFVAVSGEEKGLLGSSYFVARPPVPAESMVANINLDMVGRNHPDTVVAVGLEYSSLGHLAQSIAQERPELGLVVAPDPWPREQLFLRSDHVHFARREIPAIFFTTGLHADYHRPSDEVTRLDAGKNARIARLVFYLAHAVANAPAPPEWTQAGRDAIAPLLQR